MKSMLLKCLLFLVVVSLLSGCAIQAMQVTGIVEENLPPSEIKTRRFHNKNLGKASISEENVAVLRNVLPGQEKVSFQPFISTKAGLKKLSCRLATGITPPRMLTFASFVEESLAAQFKAADKYSPEGQMSLSGRLTTIEFSAPMVGSGLWKISLEVTASNGKLATMDSKYEFESAFGGIEACARAQEAFIPAVDKLVADLIKSPDFAAIFSQGGTTQEATAP